MGPGSKKGAPVDPGGTWLTRNIYPPIVYSYIGNVQKFGAHQTSSLEVIAVFLRGGADSTPPCFLSLEAFLRVGEGWDHPI